MGSISAFIVGTCQIHPKLQDDVFEYMQFDVLYPYETLTHTLQCGSSVEFFIKPINKGIDDIDFMKYTADVLIFTEDNPVLPDDFRVLQDKIICFKIAPYADHPGFVEFKDFQEIKYNWKRKQFEFQPSNAVIDGLFRAKLEEFFIFEYLDSNMTSEAVGPAVKLKMDRKGVNDIVLCYWCPEWPKEAKHWPVRRRNYGWPTIADIRQVVEYGCHVVKAQHPACRDDERQWRLSFSAAELHLIQRWTPVQQIVYHLLRFFAKRELMNEDCQKEDEILSTYHFKTLMLWSCEEISPEWWNSTSVIKISCSLLQKLSEWLKKEYCPNYFMPQAILFHKNMNRTVVAETIRRLNEFDHCIVLEGWFATEYILPILSSFSDVFHGPDAEIVMGIDDWALDICRLLNVMKLVSFDWQFSQGFWLCAVHLFRKVMVENGYAFNRHLTIICSFKNCIGQKVGRLIAHSTVEFSSRFPQFGKVLYILHSTIALKFKKTTYDNDIFTELIREVSWKPKVMISDYHNFPKPSKASLDSGFVLFLKAQSLLENLTGLNSLREFKLIAELSKELLGNALLCENFKSSTYRDAAFVYMAALYFLESDYETVIDLCSAVLNDQTPDAVEEERKKEMEKEEDLSATETLNAGCFYFLDDVARILGLCLLLMRIQRHPNFRYNSRRFILDLRLTPEVFAQYLILSSNERRPLRFGLSYNVHKPTFPMDEMLMTATNFRVAIFKKTRVYQRSDPLKKIEENFKHSSPNIEGIIHLLQEYSLDDLTSFYNAICKDFDIHCNVAVCYRAAYLYSRRKYSEVLHLCEKILNEPVLEKKLEQMAFTNVTVMPPLDSYFDTDIQCLLGLHTLVCYLSPLNDVLCKLDDSYNPAGTTVSKFQTYFAREIYFEKNLLSKILQEGRIRNLPYFVGGHFLARYLKVRCLIDLNNSKSEILFEFDQLKSHLPFEHIVNQFLQQKLRRQSL